MVYLSLCKKEWQENFTKVWVIDGSGKIASVGSVHLPSKGKKEILCHEVLLWYHVVGVAS